MPRPLHEGQNRIRGGPASLVRYKEHRGAAPVILGEPGDSNLLGVVTLEALGYVLDPLKRELRPSPMLLAGLATVPPA